MTHTPRLPFLAGLPLAVAAGLLMPVQGRINGALGAAEVADSPQPLPPELSTESIAPPPVPADGEETAALPPIYKIVTRPVGASITVDGKVLEGVVTPAEIELPHDAKHLLQLDLEGHKPIRWTFVAEKLSADQQRTHTLYFPLASAFEAAPAPG